jgi:beta-galactosidase
MRTILLTLVFITAVNSFAGVPREQILFDNSWKFALGNAADKTKDFGYCTGMPLAKAGAGNCGGGAILDGFNDANWRLLDQPHDWAVELPFANTGGDRVKDHGFKPVGPYFPETSIGWCQVLVKSPKTPGDVVLTISSAGLEAAKVKLRAT